MCPLGCSIDVAVEAGAVTSITGYSCGRGKAYAAQEAVAPTRMVCGLVRVAGSDRPLPVRTTQPIPRAQVPALCAHLAALEVLPPVSLGAVVEEHPLTLPTTLIATKTVT
jgi:CxxC motif-containing protein